MKTDPRYRITPKTCSGLSRPLLLFVLTAAGLKEAGAQDRTANVDQLSNSQEQAQFTEQLNDIQELSTPEIGEIGLVRRYPVPKTITGYTSQNFSFTDNAFQTSGSHRDDYYWNGRFGATLVPYSTRDFTPSLTLEHNVFRYTSLEELDFDSQTLRAAVKYDFTREDDWFSYTSYSVNRLYTSTGNINEFYRFGEFEQSFTHFRQLSGMPLFLGGTGGVTYRHGSPSALNRVTTFANASLIYIPIENLTLSFFVRPDVQFYLNDPLDSDRTDINLNMGLSAAYRYNEYVSLGANFSYTGNFSDTDVRDYDVLSPGISLSLNIAF